MLLNFFVTGTINTRWPTIYVPKGEIKGLEGWLGRASSDVGEQTTAAVPVAESADVQQGCKAGWSVALSAGTHPQQGWDPGQWYKPLLSVLSFIQVSIFITCKISWKMLLKCYRWILNRQKIWSRDTRPSWRRWKQMMIKSTMWFSLLVVYVMKATLHVSITASCLMVLKKTSESCKKKK